MDLIFESNLINLIILIVGLFKLLSEALSKSLLIRQKKVLEAIQESEEKLQEAITRLTKSEIKLAQAKFKVKEIYDVARRVADYIRSSTLKKGAEEQQRLITTFDVQIATLESKIRQSLLEYFVCLVLREASARLERLIPTNTGSWAGVEKAIIDRNISLLAD